MHCRVGVGFFSCAAFAGTANICAPHALPLERHHTRLGVCDKRPHSTKPKTIYRSLRENGPKLVTARQRLRGITRKRFETRYRASTLTRHYENTGQNSLPRVNAYAALRESGPKLVTRRHGLRGITRKRAKPRYAAQTGKVLGSFGEVSRSFGEGPGVVWGRSLFVRGTFPTDSALECSEMHLCWGRSQP